MAGVLGGVAATLVLSGLREAFTRVGLVFETAPMQVVDRVEELGLRHGGRAQAQVAGLLDGAAAVVARVRLHFLPLPRQSRWATMTRDCLRDS